MRKAKVKQPAPTADEDTMRPEYDFSKGVRGATAARFREGTNIVVLDPDVMDVFPDSEAASCSSWTPPTRSAISGFRRATGSRSSRATAQHLQHPHQRPVAHLLPLDDAGPEDVEIVDYH
jgi:hypothetical protein